MARHIGAKSEILDVHRPRCSCCTDHHPFGSSCATKTDCNCNCIGQRRQQVCIGLEWQCITAFVWMFFFDFHLLNLTKSFSTRSRAVSSIYSTVFFPIFPWIFQIAVTIFAIAVGLYLASIGQPVNQVLKLSNDTNCECTGAAQHYKVRMVWIMNVVRFWKLFGQKLQLKGFTAKAPQ